MGKPWYEKTSAEKLAVLREPYAKRVSPKPWGLDDFKVFSSFIMCTRCRWSEEILNSETTLAELIDLVQPHTKECKGG